MTFKEISLKVMDETIDHQEFMAELRRLNNEELSKGLLMTVTFMIDYPRSTAVNYWFVLLSGLSVVISERLEKI